MTRPVAVAITGGIGAGKSEALAAFARHGAATVSSDEIVHELLRSDEVKHAVVERLGNGVVGPDGELDRGAIADGRLQRPRRRSTWLEALLHPLVSAEYLRGASSSAAAEPAARVRHRGAAPLRGRLGGAVRQGRRDHRADEAAARALGAPRVDEREQRLLADSEKVAARRLRVREHGLARRARRVRRGR